MNNLYDKIYEAVNTGIQKALIISDDSNNDISIGWHEKQISSNANKNMLFDEYAEAFLNNDDITDMRDNYRKLLDLHNDHDYTYMANDIYELSDIYRQMQKIGKKNFSWVNTSNSFVLLDKNGNEMSLNQYIKAKNTFDVEFLKMKHRFGDIIIHKTFMIPKYPIELASSRQINIGTLKFGTMNQASLDFNGYEHTYKNSLIDENIDKLPAFKAVKEINDFIYDAYIPGFGELKMMFDNLKVIYYVLCQIDKKEGSCLKKNLNGHKDH